MAGWLDSVPYGGYGASTGGCVGASPDTDALMAGGILIAGLGLITGGGALVGYLIGRTVTSALVGGLAGLGLSSANLALNAGRLAVNQAQLGQPPQPAPLPSQTASAGPLPPAPLSTGAMQ